MVKKLLLLALLISTFALPCWATSTGIPAAETTVVDPEEPIVGGGEIVGDPTPIPQEKIDELKNLLQEYENTIGNGATVTVTVDEGGTSVTFTTTYPDGTGSRSKWIYNYETDEWEEVPLNESAIKDAADDAVFTVTDNSAYDNDPAVGIIVSTYVAAVSDVSGGKSSGGGGCSFGALGGLFASLLLLIPAAFFTLKK